MTTPAESVPPQPAPEPIETQHIVVEVNPDPMTSQIIEHGDKVTGREIK